jgi:hypothetical protein
MCLESYNTTPIIINRTKNNPDKYLPPPSSTIRHPHHAASPCSAEGGASSSSRKLLASYSLSSPELMFAMEAAGRAPSTWGLMG